MPNLAGRENVWTCQKCGAQLVCVDRDEGVTPFMLRCGHYKPGCGGEMYSAFYPNSPRPPHIAPPTHEWYKPTTEELNAECQKERRAAAAIREHVRLGGLLIRPITSTVAAS